MPRSDRSSDPDDGSITSDDEQAIGPTSAVTQQKVAPWQMQIDTSGSVTKQPAPVASGSTAPITQTEPIQLKSPVSPTSKLQEIVQLAQPGARRATVTGPNARFRSAVIKVMRLKRIDGLSDDDPGVDVTSDAAQALYGRIREQCSIEVMDYGATRCKSTKLTNEELTKHISHESKTRPLWAKVRWINIGGISFDVIKALAMRYHIHPLTIEDMLHGRQTYSSKADYYSQHLFIRMLCHTLKDDDDESPNVKPQLDHHDNHRQLPDGTNGTGSTPPPPAYISREPSGIELDDVSKPRMFRRRTVPLAEGGRVKSLASTSLSGAQPWAGGGTLNGDPEKVWAKSVYPELGKGDGSARGVARKYSYQLSSMFENNLDAWRQNSTQATVNALKKGERVEVKLRNLYIIMFRDGTIISIHQDVNNKVFDPIMNRLRQRDTLLRNTSDVSMLLQAIIDLLVDHAIKVVDKYHDQILKFERDILVKPKVKTVKFLHIASGDLTMHKRTLGPIKTLIYGLRRYDLDRCIAQANSADPGYDEKKVTGFLSHKSKIYLADVMDHMDYVLESLDMFSTITENLIAYTFNIVSYDMNTTMKTLTVATVIFLPLTFLTGYFGMNFQEMLSVQAHSEMFFWSLAIPVMAVTILGFSIPVFANFIHWLQKRALQRRLGVPT